MLWDYLYAREKMEIKMEDINNLDQAATEQAEDSNDNIKQLRDEFKNSKLRTKHSRLRLWVAL